MKNWKLAFAVIMVMIAAGGFWACSEDTQSPMAPSPTYTAPVAETAPPSANVPAPTSTPQPEEDQCGLINVEARRIVKKDGLDITVRIIATTDLPGDLYARIWYQERWEKKLGDWPLESGVVKKITLTMPGYGDHKITVDIEVDQDGDGQAEYQCDGGLPFTLIEDPCRDSFLEHGASTPECEEVCVTTNSSMPGTGYVYNGDGDQVHTWEFPAGNNTECGDEVEAGNYTYKVKTKCDSGEGSFTTEPCCSEPSFELVKKGIRWVSIKDGKFRVKVRWDIEGKGLFKAILHRGQCGLAQTALGDLNSTVDDLVVGSPMACQPTNWGKKKDLDCFEDGGIGFNIIQLRPYMNWCYYYRLLLDGNPVDGGVLGPLGPPGPPIIP